MGTAKRLPMKEDEREKEIRKWTVIINGMSHIEMAKLWRFAPSGHPVFNSKLPLYSIFKKRFDKLGGMTPTISKTIGW